MCHPETDMVLMVMSVSSGSTRSATAEARVGTILLLS